MKWSLLFLSVIALKTCGAGNDKPQLKIKPNANTFVAGDTLSARLRGAKQIVPDAVQYYLDDQPITLPHVFGNERLGDHQLKAVVTNGEQQQEALSSVRLLKSTPPALWTYTVINAYPHDPTAYTQGLEFDGEILYESTGLNGKSTLRKVHVETGEVLQQIPLDQQ